MSTSKSRHFQTLLAAALFAGVASASAEATFPEDSRFAGIAPGESLVLLNPMDSESTIHAGAYRMEGLSVTPTIESVEAKFGHSALRLGAERALGPGSKGDFGVCDAFTGTTLFIGMWVYLDETSNVEKLGVQVRDAEGEALLSLVPADWTGWRWVEFDLGGGDVRQSYNQDTKNGEVDFPLSSAQMVWFAAAEGETNVIVDQVSALVQFDSAPNPAVRVELSAPGQVSPDEALVATLFATNFGDQPVDLTVDYRLQRNSQFYSEVLPDPSYGSNHAIGAQSWLEIDGERVEEEATIDGKSWTGTTTEYQKDHYDEVFQYIDLGQVRNISRMTWLSNDANHAARVEVLASEDGETFSPVPGLDEVEQFKKWGSQVFPVEAPFRARVVKFRYYTGGEKVNAISLPSEIAIFDGVADEKMELPTVGTVLGQGTATLTVPPKSFAEVSLPIDAKIGPGVYFLGVHAKGDETDTVLYSNIFGDLPEVPGLVTKASRIALNSSKIELIPKLKDLGIGWVRFENMKWPFVSPAPHQYSYDGETKPWKLDVDHILSSYHEAGFGILNYMFLTPEWASEAADDGPEAVRRSHPPKDLALYGEFCFQTVARYGSKEHPASELLTEDKKSGLGLVTHYEMWNEPNLNASPEATWGGWVGTMDEYYEMMRFGAEAVKRADPDAVVTSAGYAGMTAEMVDPLRTYTYADGKHPIDFVELINVHYYSGLAAPETATDDGNAKLTGTTTFPENLRELARWRDAYASGMPIWMTETGYDSAGSFGTNEAIQAARLPRVVMLCLANGVEKVFVYREAGDTPSKHAASGVMRNDGSRKPSYYTFGTLTRQFRDVVGGAVRLPHPDPNVWLMEWDNGGKPLVTAWTVNGTSNLGVDFGNCEVVDAFGGSTTRTATSDLVLTPYPQYLSGLENSPALAELRAAQQRDQEELAARREKIEDLRKYLFDFGGDEWVGRYTREGVAKSFLPVNSDTVWDDSEGFGFDLTALGDSDRPWMGRSATLDRDSVKVRDQVFRFLVEPGKYELSFRVEPFQPTGNVIVSGMDDGPEVVPVSKEKPTVNIPVEVSGEATVLELSLEDGYASFAWISCVEDLE